MSASPFICPKVENALAALLSDEDLGGIENVYTGIEHPVVTDPQLQTRRELPAVECVCQTAQFDGHPGGSHIAQASVMVRANADDTTEDQFNDMVTAVWNVCLRDTIAAELTAAATDFHCDGVIWQGQNWQIVGRSWVAELTMEIHCAGRTIPEA
jgi:hypothetical protein